MRADYGAFNFGGGHDVDILVICLEITIDIFFNLTMHCNDRCSRRGLYVLAFFPGAKACNSNTNLVKGRVNREKHLESGVDASHKQSTI